MKETYNAFRVLNISAEKKRKRSRRMEMEDFF